MSEERPDHSGDIDNEEPPARPAPRNPFSESEQPDEERGPALIDTRRSAAVSGVIVGLIALFFVVALCVLASIAFG